MKYPKNCQESDLTAEEHSQGDKLAHMNAIKEISLKVTTYKHQTNPQKARVHVCVLIMSPAS